MPRKWTEEQKKAQAERCRAQKPWEKSTGPKTARGKQRVSTNALKHGNRCRKWDDIRYLLWLNAEFLRMTNKLLAAPGISFKNKPDTPLPPAGKYNQTDNRQNRHPEKHGNKRSHKHSSFTKNSKSGLLKT